MKPHEVLSRSLETSQRPALIAFLTAGYPDLDTFVEILEQIEAEADAVEIGVPFTDPMADGVTVQRSSHAAIENGVSLRWILDQLAARETAPAAPLLLMSYLNPLLAFGFDRLAVRAREAG
ncbi:MAG: tryptophan synthase subunit alpha, partial [Gammaproteobacteria bacterium]|nr:tryptophan synthase subunit alpha [Gammaproteobacteria bacterium]